MKNLVKIVAVGFVTLFLVHCGEDSDVVEASGIGAVEAIGCNDLDGVYKTVDIDIFWNGIPYDSNYEVNIASSLSDVLVQIKGEEGDVLCAQFSDIKRSSPTEASMSSKNIVNKIGKDNDEDFADGISSISFKEIATNLEDFSNKSCRADKLIVTKVIKVGTIKEETAELLREPKGNVKSFSVLKQECDTLQVVVKKEEGTEKKSSN